MLRICKILEITKTIYSNSERSEHYLKKDACFYLFLNIYCIGSIEIQIGKNYFDLDIYRKS